MGESCAASSSVNLKTDCCVAHRARSVGGKFATTAATRLDCFSTTSEAAGSPASPVVPSSSARCPPALLPKTPMRSGSTPYSPACCRMKRTERRTSATIDVKECCGQLPCLTAKTVKPLSFSGG